MTESDHTVKADTGADALFTEVYDRLKAMAGRQRAHAGAGTLSTTEIVHELYLRMGSDGEKRFAEPAQFFAYAARAARHLLVDSARRRMQLRAGGNLHRITLNDQDVESLAADPKQAIELDAALRQLEADDPRSAQIIELHYFAGLPIPRIAVLLGLAERTVDRSLHYARSFLSVHLEN